MSVAPELTPELYKSFALYEQYLREVNTIHPQHLGLHEAEFKAALAAPETVTTTIATSEGSADIPQLVPIEAYEWLNIGFYKKRFPESVHGNMLYFTEIPGVNPSQAVIERIQTLADSGGILAFDIPSFDPQEKDRILGFLKEIGVQFEEPQLLGTQTYFAGQSRLTQVEPAENPLTMWDMYDEAVQDGRCNPDIETGVILRHTLTQEEAQQVYNFYEEAYEGTPENPGINDHPCKQGLSPEEFREMCVNQPDVAKILYLNEGKPTAIYLACNALERLSWVNKSYYDKQYPERMDKGQVVWFPGIALDKSSDVSRSSKHMVDFMADMAQWGGNDFLAVFDFCDANAEWLPNYLSYLINDTGRTTIDIQPIAAQQYLAVRLLPQQ